MQGNFQKQKQNKIKAVVDGVKHFRTWLPVREYIIFYFLLVVSTTTFGNL